MKMKMMIFLDSINQLVFLIEIERVSLRQEQNILKCIIYKDILYALKE
jgi:hypothetical protein